MSKKRDARKIIERLEKEKEKNLRRIDNIKRNTAIILNQIEVFKAALQQEAAK